VQINKEKHQAFVEFLTPEDATAALSFDGRSLKGSALKIRRPKEYVEMAVRILSLSLYFFCNCIQFYLLF
jgi:RNA recognition motif-containing protein